MQTPDQAVVPPGSCHRFFLPTRSGANFLPALMQLVLFGFLIGGCSKDSGMASIETDAHGYLCQQCGAKFYTGRKEFLESKCPKCQQYTLVDVVGYMCQKDNHLTIRPRVSGPEGAAICEVCQTHLKDAMVSPREKDLIAWGATKTGPQPAH
jgi:phage FluMu protein Com